MTPPVLVRTYDGGEVTIEREPRCGHTEWRPWVGECRVWCLRAGDSLSARANMLLSHRDLVELHAQLTKLLKEEP